ncbi:MAG: tRNA (adenosine(37)-N6)-threonylcarbamoyltransferase complex dimerization subunit type 1 TsaB [Deltaproteobacteria bacterium]|nr:tRNA (adenosine(37)-N6)-threonylcarbamoyltransferase complex dimerization subunit type 1 TsaB [Deltaproteobacteria bacterium]
MITLAVDTATKTASVALLEGTTILGESFLNIGKNHGETLLPEIMALLTRNSITIDEIDLFAVTLGPGSFTGLRIGASTVKGLAFTVGKPVEGICTLDALTLNVSDISMMICPMLDARKKEVYTALYKPGDDYFPEKIVGETVSGPEHFVKNISENVMFLGDGALLYKDVIGEILPDKSYFASDHLNHIRASSVGLIGLKKFYDGDNLNLLTFTPQYLRVSEAEAKRLSKK